MKLRSVTVEDVETLFDIRCSVGENHQSRERLAELGVTPDSVSAMVTGGDHVSLIAEEDGRAAGFVMACVSEGYVFACFVRPEHEGRGIGGALLRAAEASLHDAGVERAWLSTGAEEGLRAIGFYRRLGWVEDGRLDDGQIRFVKALGDAGAVAAGDGRTTASGHRTG